MAAKRIAWVDYAKGIAIIGVFLMHSALPVTMSSYIGSFDMMLFFALSGYVFSTRRFPTFRQFVWNRVRTLVIPGVLLAVIPFIITELAGLGTGEFQSYPKYALGFLVNLRSHYGFGELPWFLSCLFLMEIGAYVLVTVARRIDHIEAVYAVMAGVTLIVGYAYSALIHKALPWSGDIALALFPFFILGMIFRRFDTELQDKLLQPVTMLPALAVLGVCGWLNGASEGVINPYLNRYGNFFYYVLAAVAGIWLVLALCHWIESRQHRGGAVAGVADVILRYWGRNTLVFYCINDAIYPRLIPWLLGLLGFDVGSAGTGTQIVCGLLALVINLLVCTPVAELINRCCPQLLGHGKSTAHSVQGKHSRRNRHRQS
ncbi:acyltransferase family protein [Bifidobacterium callimiconis]|uniref:Acyltransferase n=1 Tax=Bifidobacterium callimiconis TaxID=2306973 RepID=A0A430FE83_9BIFI|nr:acyltransferase [Bifidobacterium callimiconis]RSX51153.1 acyltransferase [Bifidobacterium callimiconis]